ncbi:MULTISPECIES: AP2 domain-containing protein [unclassified Burkholderia]|uniref:AP2 domain-containing protein n=1 Tax=unclassified Burkholderia TaxID=2613784 RepID=UPI00163B571A|nr:MULTISPECIES: AP2 domain-containing protein [unclassified Burkholderia]
MKEIRLTNGSIALVDDGDFEALSKYTWSLSPKGYARRRWVDRRSGKKMHIFMHRQILGLVNGDGSATDHIDGDRLNNQRANIRICTLAENNRNRRINRSSGTGFKGVCRRACATHDRFVARIKFNYKSIYLGTFDTAEEAHQSYCAAAKRLYGEFASSGA